MSVPYQTYDRVIIDIVDYVFDYKIHRAESLQRARTLILDTFGCAIESSKDASIQAIIGSYIPGSSMQHGFCLPGTMIQEDPVKGAFDFGTMIRYLDHNDALGGKEWGHPSDNLGAIVAVMDWLDRSSQGYRNGPPLTVNTLLHAMIKAYEIQGIFQIENSFNEVSIDHTILVKVASTAVISWLAGLSKDGAAAAVSQAWMDGHPLRTYRAFPNANPRKGWAAGDACSRAVHLLYLTMKGLPAGPKPLTAKRWGFYDSLFRGKQFQLPAQYGETIIHNTIVKLIACEGHVLTAAEAALKIGQELRKQGFDPRTSIAKIKIRTQRPALLITDKTGPLTNLADRDHCFQYIVAVVLLKGEQISAEDYQDSSPFASDPAVDHLRESMELSEDESFTREYYDLSLKSVPSGISLMLKDGRWLDEVVIHVPMGHPRHPHTISGTIEKYKRNLGLLFSPQQIEQMHVALHNDELPVSEFINLYRCVQLRSTL